MVGLAERAPMGSASFEGRRGRVTPEHFVAVLFWRVLRQLGI